MTPSLHEESRFVARKTSLSLPLFSKVSESSERVSGHVYSKKKRQCNGENKNKKNKKTNNDLQNTNRKLKIKQHETH
jgi:hypothetical protein